MSTLADELLQDFEDSGSEGDEDQNGGLFRNDGDVDAGSQNYGPSRQVANGDMELDGDEEVEDEQMDGAELDTEENEDATRAKVEKMQLRGVDDVRSVASLMKTLEPVLEVGKFQRTSFSFAERRGFKICTFLFWN